jgi:glycogen synthase
LRIAFVTYEYPPDTGKGGIGTYTIQLASLLVSNKFDVHVFAGTDKPSYYEELQHVHIHRVHCTGPQDFKINVVPVFSAEQNVKAFDIIESPEIHGNAWEIKKAFSQIPLVVRLHAPNYLVEHLKKKYTPLFAKLRFVLGALRRGKIDVGYWRKYDYLQDPDYTFVQIADAITAPSNTMKQWAVNNWKILPSKINVIPNPFIPSDAFLHLPINRNGKKKEIVFFGRLNVLKGLVNATHAMKKILLEFKDYHFKVIGDDGAGPNAGESMQTWMQNRLSSFKENVHFYKGQAYEDLPALIADAEIVLLPSLFESFSYTCAEAMAAGKAVIGSKETGMEDMITSNKNGILIDAENVDDIYNAIKKVIVNEALRYSMSILARTIICTKFSGGMLAQKYMNYYKDVVLFDN